MNLKKIQSRFSLQAKIILLTTGLLVTCMIIFSSISVMNSVSVRKKLAENEVRKTAALIATVHSMYREPDWNRTEEYMDLVMGLYTDRGSEELLEVLYILVRDEQRVPRILKVNQDLARKFNFNVTSLESDLLGNVSGFEQQGFPINVPNMNVVTMPVMVNGESRGIVETGHLVARLNASERYIIKINAIALIALCFVGVVVGALTSRKALEPVLAVVKAMKRMEQGALAVRVLESSAPDTRILTEGFNSMAYKLNVASAGLREKTGALEESEKKYRSLYESASDGILLLDGGGVCRDANIAASHLFGVPADELKNTLLFDIIEPSQPGINFSNCPTRWSGVTRIPGAKNCHVETQLSAIDENLLIAVVRDVTPWKKAEDAVKRAKRRQHNMVQNLPMGIVVVNNDMKITECNRFVCSLMMTQYDEANLPEWESLKSGFPNDFEVRVKKALRTGKDVELNTVKFISPDEKEHVMDVKINMFQMEPGEAHAVLIVMDDITEKVKMERVQMEYEKRIMETQKMEIIGALAGRFAHDFNNILSVILGNAEFGMSNNRNIDGSFTELENIRSAALQGQDLTMRLLTFVQKEKIQERIKSLQPVLDEAVMLIESALSGNINIRRNYVEESLFIKMDSGQLVQAFINILNNAREAMPNGGLINVTVTDIADEEDAKTNMCRVRITDTGKGIKSTLLHRVFDPFFTSKSMGEHTGLGLSTSLRIIENHGGHISINSAEGSGTTVDIYLPITDPALKIVEDKRKERAAEPPAGQAARETILIVDDNVEMLMIAEKILKKRGFGVITATDGESAIDIFKEEKDNINLVIMDMIMPGISGKKTLEKISEIKTGVKSIIMTGFSDEEETLELLSAGLAAGYVQKPFRADQLYLTIREILDDAKG